jgi:hypothetical protein
MIDAATGGRLDHDARGGTNTAKLKNENIHFPNPLMGVSTVYVHNYNQFGETPDPFSLEVHLGDYTLLYSDTLKEGHTSPACTFRYDGPPTTRYLGVE